MAEDEVEAWFEAGTERGGVFRREDDKWVVMVTDARGCLGTGETENDLRAAVKQAIEDYARHICGGV